MHSQVRQTADIQDMQTVRRQLRTVQCSGPMQQTAIYLRPEYMMTVIIMQPHSRRLRRHMPIQRRRSRYRAAASLMHARVMHLQPRDMQERMRPLMHMSGCALQMRADLQPPRLR